MVNHDEWTIADGHRMLRALRERDRPLLEAALQELVKQQKISEPLPLRTNGGGGAEGRVWIVRQPEFDGHRAIKLIWPHLREKPEKHRQYRESLSRIARVHHQCMAQIHECGTARNGVEYFIMELVPSRRPLCLLFKAYERKFGVELAARGPRESGWAKFVARRRERRELLKYYRFAAELLAQVLEVLHLIHTECDAEHNDPAPRNFLVEQSIVEGPPREATGAAPASRVKVKVWLVDPGQIGRNDPLRPDDEGRHWRHGQRDIRVFCGACYTAFFAHVKLRRKPVDDRRPVEVRPEEATPAFLRTAQAPEALRRILRKGTADPAENYETVEQLREDLLAFAGQRSLFHARHRGARRHWENFGNWIRREKKQRWYVAGLLALLVGTFLLFARAEHHRGVAERLSEETDARYALANLESGQLEPANARLAAHAANQSLPWRFLRGQSSLLHHPLPELDRPVADLQFSRDPERLYALTEAGRVYVHEPGRDEFRPIDFPELEPTRYTRLAVSPDGRRLAALSKASTVSVLDVPSRKRIHRSLKGAQTICMSGDGRYCAYDADFRYVRVVDLESEDLKSFDLERTLREWKPDTRPLDLEASSLAFSPGSRWLALASLRSIWVWNLAERRERFLFDRNNASTIGDSNLEWSDSTRLIASADRGVRLKSWNLAEAAPVGLQLDNLQDFDGITHLACFGRRIAYSDYQMGKVTVIDAGDGRGIWGCAPPNGGRPTPVAALRWSPDGSRMAYARQKTVWVADWRDRFPLPRQELAIDPGRTRLAVDARAERFAVFDELGRPTLWSPSKGTFTPRRLAADALGINPGLHFARDGRLALASFDLDGNHVFARFQFFDAAGNPARKISIPLDASKPPLDDYGRRESAFPETPQPVCALGDGGRFAIVGNITPRHAGSWLLDLDAETGRPIDLDDDAFFIKSAWVEGNDRAFWLNTSGSPPSRFQLAEGSATNRMDFRFAVPSSIDAVAVAPDEREFAFGGRDLTIWLCRSGEPNVRRKLIGHSRRIVSVKFASDRKHLVSADVGGTVILWSLASGNETLRFDTAPGLQDLALTSGGELLITTHADGRLFTWPLRKEWNDVEPKVSP